GSNTDILNGNWRCCLPRLAPIILHPSVSHPCFIRGYSPAGWLVAVCIVLLAAGPVAAQQGDDARSREVARLIDQLGSEDFAIRERAGKRLLEIGEDAFDAVNEAARSAKDAEVRFRAVELLGSLKRRKFAAARRWDDHRDIVWAVAFSPDSKLLATGGGGDEMDGNWTAGSDFALRVWNVSTGELAKRLEGHASS